MDVKKARFNLLKKLRGWFLSGLIILAPIILTIYIVSWLLTWVDSIFWVLLPNFKIFTELRSITGVGLIIVLIIIVFVGMIGKSFIIKPFFSLLKSIFEFTPFVKSIFNAINTIFGSIFSDSGKSFKEVVLIEYPSKGSFAYGFVTCSFKEGEVYNKINNETPTKEVLHVFVPTAPNPTSGFMIITPAERVKRISIPTSLAMNIVISGGMIPPTTKPTDIENKD